MKFHSLKDIENKVPKPGSFKHFLRIQEHGGRVVKGVNTTADVGVDAIKKQAAKFGNKVDKDGRPPTLSKKVKGSKTNVLFNLGMTESVDNTDESMLYYAKMAENLGELASTSKVYVDMDGVLADFFGEWQKLIGKDWRKVKDIEPALQKIRDKDNFWLDLPLLPQAKNLLGVIKKVKGSYTILSSPLPNDPNSEPHKREWIKKNLDFFPPENVIITHDKPKYAVNSDGTPNILIDDFGKNIASWEAAGGEGFKHKDHKFERTAKAIQQHMQEPVSEGAEITMWTNPEYQGADVDDKYYKKQPVKRVDVSKLTPFEPADKMDPKDNHDNMMKFVDKIKAGEKVKPIVIVPHEGKLLVVDGHHRYFAHKKAGVDKIRAVIADPKDLTWRDDVPESVKERSLSKGEEKEKERIVKGMKKKKGDFKDRYGKDADAVMYATATKMAKEALISGLYTTDRVLDLLENFADGKKSGKSRPGRVKKSGASCSSSVTELRKKAKNASGERAKMYHWCANMKSGKKKNEIKQFDVKSFLSEGTEYNLYLQLKESTPQQLQEGIADSLKKLPKNLLSKVTPIIKKIPKTAKNLTLMAVLLGTMVNAVAAGDMQKVDTPLDKLNNMTTMSATMDTGNDIGPGQMAPKNIDVIKMPTPPPAPGADTPDGTNDNGVSTQTDKNGNRTVSSGAGTYTFSGDGNLLKYETPKIKGLQQTHDIAKKTVTVDFTGQSGDANIDQKATYDMNGKLISGDRIGISSGDMSVSIDKDKGKTVDIKTLSGTKHSLNDKDPKKYDKLAAMKKDMDQSQADFKKANTATLKKMGISR